MRSSRLFALIALITLSACSYSSTNRRYILMTSGQGDAIDVSDRHELSPAEFQLRIEDIIKYIDATAPIRNGKKQVLFYIHGGVVTYNTSVSTADRAKDPIQQAGFYPIFFVWSSDLGRAYMQHLFFVRQGQHRAIVGPITSPFFLVGDLLDGVIHAPGTYYEQLKSLFSRALRQNSDARKRQQLLMASTTDSLTLIPGRDRRGAWGRTVRVVLYPITLLPKLVVMPLVDGLGEPAFVDMKRRTESMFRRPEEYQTGFNQAATDPQQLASYGGGTGAAARFLFALEQRVARRDDIEITLVGHSMGAIVANKIIRYHPTLPIKHIIYMAAACTIDDFRDTIVPYMRTHKSTRFYNLSLHPKAETAEVQWWFLDFPPRGTLLEWIDNFLSSPATESERTMGKWGNIILASHLIPVDVRSRVVLKSFGAGVKGDPQIHGSFDEYPFWDREFWGDE